MKEDIQNCLNTLREGGIILYPTDTVWGIGCDASNPQAIQKIYDLKGRTSSKALITLVGSEVMLERTVINMPEIAWDLIESANRPLTLIYDEVKGIAPNAIAEDGSCGIRLTNDTFCQQLIQRLGKPIISTSANVSGEETPKDFRSISDTILKGVDFVVNYRQNEATSQKSSNIIKLKNNGEIKIIR
ncbi:MAG: L-threonylcarbamoyladenylate synthase [Bacteroidota bacterium]|nr:L-threonylcarbamoyladenylate synthase [Bacteroidota bacterium]